MLVGYNWFVCLFVFSLHFSSLSPTLGILSAILRSVAQMKFVGVMNQGIFSSLFPSQFLYVQAEPWPWLEEMPGRFVVSGWV